MIKKTFTCVLCLAALLSTSCGSSKKAAADNYYVDPNPKKEGMLKQPTEKKRDLKEVEKLAATESANMRAVGIGNDFDLKYARREAIRDGQNTLAGFLETTIINLTKEYHKKATANTKKFSETNLEEYVETSVAQTISTRVVGTPETYDLSDGSIRVYVCVELSTPTKDVLSNVYDQMSQDEILGTDYDKTKFIEDNMNQLDQLREKAAQP